VTTSPYELSTSTDDRASGDAPAKTVEVSWLLRNLR